MFVSPALGFTPWHRIPQLYCLALVPLGLHYFRSLTAHNYLSDGKKQTFHDQIMDSIDITGVPILTELLYPIGLRYHALHHLFPSMPYHNLATAHRRLMAELPADSPYRQVVYPTVWSVLRELIHHSAPSPNFQRRSKPARPLDTCADSRCPATPQRLNRVHVAISRSAMLLPDGVLRRNDLPDAWSLKRRMHSRSRN